MIADQIGLVSSTSRAWAMGSIEQNGRVRRLAMGVEVFCANLRASCSRSISLISELSAGFGCSWLHMSVCVCVCGVSHEKLGEEELKSYQKNKAPDEGKKKQFKIEDQIITLSYSDDVKNGTYFIFTVDSGKHPGTFDWRNAEHVFFLPKTEMSKRNQIPPSSHILSQAKASQYNKKKHSKDWNWSKHNCHG